VGAAGRQLRRLLRAAQRRWPTSPLWPSFLATSYARLAWDAPDGTEARRRYAAEAIRWFEREEDLWPRDPVAWRNPDAEDEYTHLRNRGTMAWFALEIGDVARAELWADDALRIPTVRAQIPWRVGPDPEGSIGVHLANVVLGTIAIGRGDLDEAERRLSLAAKAWSSPEGPTQWLDPDFSLARALLEHDLREPVLAYLAACRETWVYGAQHVDRWTRTIEGGATPDFAPWSHARPSRALTWLGVRSSLRSLRRSARATPPTA
jgi:hypothetical protein